jgi:hypothetical protein
MSGFRVGPDFGRAARTKNPRAIDDRPAPDGRRVNISRNVAMGLVILGVLSLAASLLHSVIIGDGLRPHRAAPGPWTFPIVGLTGIIPVLLASIAVTLVALVRYVKRRSRGPQ